MRSFFLLLLIIATVTCSGCQDTCECPDFTSLHDDWYQNSLPIDRLSYTKQAGCVFTAKCTGEGRYILVEFRWNETEIEKPSDSTSDEFQFRYPDFNADFYTAYGISCENGSWYASQYTGELIIRSEDRRIEFDPAWNGKKSRIQAFYCIIPTDFD